MRMNLLWRYIIYILYMHTDTDAKWWWWGLVMIHCRFKNETYIQKRNRENRKLKVCDIKSDKWCLLTASVAFAFGIINTELGWFSPRLSLYVWTCKHHHHHDISVVSMLCDYHRDHHQLICIILHFFFILCLPFR